MGNLCEFEWICVHFFPCCWREWTFVAHLITGTITITIALWNIDGASQWRLRTTKCASYISCMLYTHTHTQNERSQYKWHSHLKQIQVNASFSCARTNKPKANLIPCFSVLHFNSCASEQKSWITSAYLSLDTISYCHLQTTSTTS